MSREWWFLDWDFQIKMRPVVDAVYKQVWGDDIEIFRADKGYRGAELDRILAIDTRIRFPSGQALTGQEKSLRFNERFYNCLTVEYMQNPETGEEGDWSPPHLIQIRWFYIIGCYNYESSNAVPVGYTTNSGSSSSYSIPSGQTSNILN